jgi:flagellar basal body-associated protein FliL
MESEKQSKRKNIIIAIIMSAQVVITLLFLMFAFYQKVEADTQRAMAVSNAQGARVAQVEAQKLIDSLTIEVEKLKVLVEKK